MAHARGRSTKSKGKGKSTSQWGGWFVRCDIPAEHKDTLAKTEVDHIRLGEWEETMAGQGYKYSCSQQEDGTAFIASLTDRSKDSPTYQGTLIARAPTAGQAKLALYWKHETMLLGMWPDPDEEHDSWG